MITDIYVWCTGAVQYLLYQPNATEFGVIEIVDFQDIGYDDLSLQKSYLYAYIKKIMCLGTCIAFMRDVIAFMRDVVCMLHIRMRLYIRCLLMCDYDDSSCFKCNSRADVFHDCQFSILGTYWPQRLSNHICE